MLARERKPPGTTLQRAYGVLDAYGLPRNYLVETNHDDCDIASEAPEVVPSNPVPANATRQSSVLAITTPAKEIPSEVSDNTSTKPTNEKLAEDKAPLESAESPSTMEDVPKAPSETTQDNNAASETNVTPEKIKIPSDTMADIKNGKV